MATSTKLTDELIQRAASRVRRGASPHAALVDEGIPRQTASYWLQRGRGEHPTAAPTSPHVDLMEAVEIAEAVWHGQVCQHLSLQPSWRAKLVTMQLRFPDEYGPVDAPIARRVLGGATLRRLRQVERRSKA